MFICTSFCLNAQRLEYQINAYAIPTHSASWARMNARQSSQEIDAVFFNPAGTTSLTDGFYISLINQSQMVRNELVAEYDFLNERRTTYPWEINNFLFPELQIVWKRNKIALSGFLTPAIGGGGSTTFNALPVGDLPISDLTALAELLYGAELNYDYNFSFEGLAYAPSLYAGIAYQATPSLSFSGGIRYNYFLSTSFGNINGLSFTPLSGAFTEDEASIAAILEGLIDLKIDAIQKGNGITPVFGVNYNFDNKLYLSSKFEFKTFIDLTTEVRDDNGGSFIPGTEGIYVHDKVVSSDLPANLSIGIRYNFLDRITLAAGHRLFFFKGVNWNGREKFVNRNYQEYDVAVEVDVGKDNRWKVSGGYSHSRMDIDDGYQNDVNFFMPSHSLTMGALLKVNEVISLEAGIVKVFYVPQTYHKDYEIFAGELSNLLKPVEELFNTTIELPSSKVKHEISGDVWLFAWSANIKLVKKEKR